MNKYQEAWSEILSADDKVDGQWTPIVREILLENYKGKDFSKYVNLIQELVDKATPKKPLNIWYGLTEQFGNCPNCDKKLFESVMELAYSKDDDLEYFKEVKLSNCNRCGQALDWSNDD